VWQQCGICGLSPFIRVAQDPIDPLERLEARGSHLRVRWSKAVRDAQKARNSGQLVELYTKVETVFRSEEARRVAWVLIRVQTESKEVVRFFYLRRGRLFAYAERVIQASATA